MSNYNVTPNLLHGLGKPTRRGIKKCLKCGVYNGTRGAFCKNKQCGVSLKMFRDKYAFDFDSVKLVTGTIRQVYSVRVKDMASECRGFVQLPLLQSPLEDVNNVLSDVALCFVDSCQRSFDNSILKCHEEEQNCTETCVHINLALKSQTIAKPISFDKSILKHLKIPTEVKDELNSLSCSSTIPLVQRVSKNVMAVKCQVTPKQPLGYLHFTFIKGRNKGYEKYYCNCTEYLTLPASSDQMNTVQSKCIHYYACIAALSSDSSYAEEFFHFINNEIAPKNKIVIDTNPKITKQVNSVNVSRSNISNQLISKPVLPQKDLSKSIIEQKSNIKKCKKIVPKIYPIEIKVLNETESIINGDDGVTWHFLDCLAFIAESINKTMEFINCGIINTQVFYIPEVFFQSIKKRIPEIYVATKSDTAASFYSIMNVNHVKEIFDTPKVKLRVAKKFIHDEQKGYVEYDENSENEQNNTEYHSSFIFFLNVGQSTVDESDNYNNAFVIEWLPNICNITKIGQLKLQYKYGRKSI